MCFYPEQTAHILYLLAISLAFSQWLDPFIHSLNLIRQIFICDHIFWQRLFVQSFQFKIFKPFKVCDCPICLAAFKSLPFSEYECQYLLLDLFQHQLLVIPHADIFLNGIIFIVRYIYLAVSMECKASCYVPCISSVRLDAIGVCNRHRCWR